MSRFLWNLKYAVRHGGRRFRSGEYWEQRYKSGGDSGAGSKGVLARYKAAFLNEFVRVNAVQSVLEFGCGDGMQVLLSDYPCYLGFDISPSATTKCSQSLAGRSGYGCMTYDPEHFFNQQGGIQYEMAMSLDVLYHLIEEGIWMRHIDQLFQTAKRYVVIYAEDCDRDRGVHMRSRSFSPYIAKIAPDWVLDFKVDNPYPYDGSDYESGSVSDFFIYRKKDAPPAVQPVIEKVS